MGTAHDVCEIAGDGQELEIGFNCKYLLDAIRALLPPEDYRLLCRITLEGATHLEVAKELGISVWSSQKRLQRIRKKLCKQLLPNKSKKISENMSVLRF